MFAPVMVLFSLLQFVDHNSKASDQMLRGTLALEPARRSGWNEAHADSDRRLAAYQEQRFAGSMNQFVAKLREFVQQYNSDRTINVKKIKALKKAWRDLEQTEPWLRPLPQE